MIRRERGNMLLVVIVMTTLITLFLAMTMVPINTTNQRMREQELIYRGEHIAEGIRRYYAKYGRFPLDLDELVEQEPRFVRKVYKDPMTKEGDWVLVYLTANDRNAIRGLNSALGRVTGQDTGEVNSENVDERTPSRLFDGPRQQITGIRSKSEDEGLMVREDSSIYSDWLFSALPKPKMGLGDITDQMQNSRPIPSGPGQKPPASGDGQ